MSGEMKYCSSANRNQRQRSINNRNVCSEEKFLFFAKQMTIENKLKRDSNICMCATRLMKTENEIVKMKEANEASNDMYNWKEWVDSLERSNTKTMKEKRGRFRIFIFVTFSYQEKEITFFIVLFFFFGCLLTRCCVCLRNNERNYFPMMMTWTTTIAYVWVTNSLWSKRIVLGNWNYDIRTSDVCTLFGRMSVKLLGTHNTNT